MFNFFKKTDAQIEQDVKSELKWDPSVTASEISVTARDGIVTLRGNVPHYFEKSTALDAAQRVGGVKIVADELEVELMGSYERSDEDISEAILNAFAWNYTIPKGIKVSVEKGWVTLKGNTEWDYQRNAASNAVKKLMGVRGVSNEIAIISMIDTKDVKTNIEDTLRRSAEVEGREIKVAVNGGKVTLSGKVHSYSEMQDARFAAWSAPGVSEVDVDLKIAA